MLQALSSNCPVHPAPDDRSHHRGAWVEFLHGDQGVWVAASPRDVPPSFPPKPHDHRRGCCAADEGLGSSLNPT